MVDLPPLKDVIARHGLDARRSLGQHFLLDPGLIERIVRSGGALDGRHVVEVGPGPGGLTRALLASAATDVLAVELDRRAIAALAELEAAYPGRLTVLEADATKLDLAALVPAPRVLTANLPYNVATPLLVGWLRQADQWERMTLMFQLEVAERISAAPDTPAFGRLSVLAGWTCRTTLLLRLPPGAFAPPPKVWSAVVGLVPHAQQPPPDLFATMERLTAAAFGQRRKMLRGRPAGVGRGDPAGPRRHRPATPGRDPGDPRMGPPGPPVVGPLAAPHDRVPVSLRVAAAAGPAHVVAVRAHLVRRHLVRRRHNPGAVVRHMTVPRPGIGGACDQHRQRQSHDGGEQTGEGHGRAPATERLDQQPIIGR